MSGKSRKLLVFLIGYTLELTATQLLDRCLIAPSRLPQLLHRMFVQDVHNLVAVQQEMH
jgi:hypothetical protein